MKSILPAVQLYSVPFVTRQGIGFPRNLKLAGQPVGIPADNHTNIRAAGSLIVLDGIKPQRNLHTVKAQRLQRGAICQHTGTKPVIRENPPFHCLAVH